MDAEEENMELKEMSERIAELEHSQSQLKTVNAERRRWLEVAGDEVADLRLENTALADQVKTLQKCISDEEQVEVELCRVRTLLAEQHHINKLDEKEIQKWENEQNIARERNKKLIAELNSLQHQRDQNKINICSLRAALQTLQSEMEESQLELKNRDDVLHQQNLQLRRLEESKQESSDIVKDLRLRIQEAKNQLEVRQDDASCAGLDDFMAGGCGRPLSFAEEMELLASSAVESTEAEEKRHKMELESPPVKVQTKRWWRSCVKSLAIGALKAGTFTLGFLVPLGVFASAASRCCGENSDFFSFNTLWSTARFLIQPYCYVDYGHLPPI